MNNTLKLKKMIKELYPYASRYLKLSRKPIIKLVDDKINSKNVWGMTGHYNPENYTITVYITGRSEKDALRSLCHELVHFSQHLKGKFDENMTTEQGYAQKNLKLRKLEQEAYTIGNFLLRDFEDQIIKNKKTTSTSLRSIPLEEHFKTRNNILFDCLLPHKEILKEVEFYKEDKTNWELVKTLKEKLLKLNIEDVIMFAILTYNIPRVEAIQYVNIAKELIIGQKEEYEHNVGGQEAEKIAIDHLKEIPNYYTRLKAAGL